MIAIDVRRFQRQHCVAEARIGEVVLFAERERRFGSERAVGFAPQDRYAVPQYAAPIGYLFCRSIRGGDIKYPIAIEIADDELPRAGRGEVLHRRRERPVTVAE